MSKLVKVEVVTPGTVAEKLDELLLFDSCFLDVAARQELLRLIPKLVHVRRARQAIFRRYGCQSCHRKRVAYGAGGFCNRCAARDYRRVKTQLEKMGEGRNAGEETAALTRRIDIAQFLLNGGDE
jgi:cytochrome c551/c552